MAHDLMKQLAAEIDDGFFDPCFCRDRVLRLLHPAGAACPNCRTGVPQGKPFASFWTGGRVCCQGCNKWFTAHTGTILAGTELSYQRIMALAVLAGFGVPDRDIAARLEIHRDTVRDWRNRLALLGKLGVAYNNIGEGTARRRGEGAANESND